MAHPKNFTRQYTMKNIPKQEFPASEGVFFSDFSLKWVVRLENKTTSKKTKPFVSAAQFNEKELAETYYNNLPKKEPCNQNSQS